MLIQDITKTIKQMNKWDSYSPDPDVASKAAKEFSKLSLTERLDVGSRSSTGQTYFLKGQPWTQKYSRRYGKPDKGTYGDYFIEVSDNVPFIPIKTNEKLIPEVMKNLEKNYNPEIKGIAIPKANVLSEKVIPLDENVKLYKPDWLLGFKEIKTRKYQSGGKMLPLEQKSDNTYVEKPRAEEPLERTVNVAKLSGLDEPDWFRRFKETKTGKHQSEESFKSQLYAATNRNPYGRPLEQGLINVYPEMALTGFIRSGIMGLLPSLKNSVTSTAAGITSREVKDKMIKGLEQATVRGEKIDGAIKNSAKTIVTKGARAVVPRLPERMQKPAMRAINIGWNFATSSYGKNAQIGTVNDVVNE